MHTHKHTHTHTHTHTHRKNSPHLSLSNLCQSLSTSTALCSFQVSPLSLPPLLPQPPSAHTHTHTHTHSHTHTHTHTHHCDVFSVVPFYTSLWSEKLFSFPLGFPARDDAMTSHLTAFSRTLSISLQSPFPSVVVLSPVT